MQNIIYAKSSNTIDSRLRSALNNLKKAEGDWNSSKADQSQSDQYLRSSYNEFERAEWPVQRATFDTPNRDSSWEGRDIDRAFRSGDRYLDNAEFKVRSARRGLSDVDEKVEAESATLQGLITDMEKANDERVETVREALSHLSQADGSFNSVKQSWRSAERSITFTDNDIRRADHDINQIIFDRPGRDVSHNAYRVDSALRGIQMDLRQMHQHFQSSKGATSAASGELSEAIEDLQMALAGEEA